MRIAPAAIVFASLTIAFPAWLSPAFAEKRVALVIGNGAYQKVGKLTNPTNDAKAISGMLQSAGFDEVALYENLGIREMRRAIGDFADLARDADTAVVYYSGHGMEMNGTNYLIPVDAVLDRDIDVPFEAYSLDSLVQVLDAARRLRLVMLDACRDNPFARTMKRTVGARAVGRGLAPVELLSVNTLIGYAAKAGSIALDGEGANSPYVRALLNNLATPGLDVRIAFGRVRDEVLKVTRNKQEPFVYGSLGGGNVSILDAPSSSSPGAGTLQAIPAPVDRAAQAWAVTQNTTSAAVLEDFIRQFGNTPYGSMARARLDELKKSKVSVMSSSSSPTSSAVRPVTITGKWVWQAKCENGTQWTGEFEFVQNTDGSFSGNCRATSGPHSCSDSSGRVVGNRVTFSVYWSNVLAGNRNRYDFTISDDGRSMRGIEKSHDSGVCTYQAKRQPSF